VTGTTYVLVPGAGGHAWYWHRVEAELRRRGHDVVAVDLLADDDSAGLREYADTIVNAAGDRGTRGDLVIVAQSMGAYAAPLVCDQLPVSRFVLVNPMIPAPGETPGDWWGNTGQPEAKREMDIREGRAPDADFDPFVTFFHDVPQHVVDQGLQHDRQQSDTPFGQPWPLSAWPDVPTTVLTAVDDRLFPADFQRRLAEDRLGVTPVRMPGGHLVALSRPVELADLIEAG
jgi:pimeloyl-ACP methyl ester carboxylesterase